MTPRPEAERDFRPDVQGLRAIAVSLVVLYHLYPSAVPGGYIGVDVFFVISGFLITGHLARTFQRRGRVGLIDFYGRRARRLMPAAVLVLLVTWFASREFLPGTQLPAAAEQIRASALYFQNWVLAHDAVDYLKSDQAASPVQHFWSLSVEEQFYLFWPFLFLVAGAVAWVATRRRRGTASEAATRVGRPVMFGLALLVVVASLVYSAHLTDNDPAAAYFVTTTRMWELGFGGALALLSVRWSDRLARVGVLAWAGLAMIIVSAFVITASSPFPGTIALWPVAGATLLVACGSRVGRFGTSRLTSLPPMVFLGDISYSLYLWHWPIIVIWTAYSGNGIGVFDGPAIAAVSIVLAWLTKVFVEDRVRLAPFIARSKGRSIATALIALVPVLIVSQFIATEPGPFHGRNDALHPGAAAIAGGGSSTGAAPAQPGTGESGPGGVGTGGVGTGGSAPAGAGTATGSATKQPSGAVVPPLSEVPKDFSNVSGESCQTSPTATAPDICTVGDKVHPRFTVALVGDSVAGEWMPAMDTIGKKLHWKVVVDTKSSCAWSSTMTVRNGATDPYTSCLAWGRIVLHDLLTTIKPAAVIVSDRPVYGTPSHPTSDAVSRAAIGKGMADYMKQLAAHGIGVVAVRETPEMGHVIPDCLSSRGGSNESCSVPASKAIVQNVITQYAVRDANGAATLVDMNPYICGQVCDAIVGNIVVYRDKHHLTRTYSYSLAPYLQQKLLATPAFKNLAG